MATGTEWKSFESNIKKTKQPNRSLMVIKSLILWIIAESFNKLNTISNNKMYIECICVNV